MRINTAQNNIQSGGMNLEVHYRIEANAKSFGVLSGDMYSHIIPTIVRELSSNAFDAHLEAEKRGEVGQGSVPFTVGCPTAFDPYFTVYDEGIGLRYYKFDAEIHNDASKDVEGDITSTVFIKGDIRKRVANIDTIILTLNGESRTIGVPSYLYDKSRDESCFRINGEFEGDATIEFDDTLVLYSTYFKSTKEETDDYIGGFGLGAKTPLAYTSNFMVTNRFEGTERVYSIYKNEVDMPCINLMGSISTDRHNGMEVKMGVDPSDYTEFKEAIEDQLKFFTPQPTVLNDVVVMPKVLYTGKYFLLMDTDNRDDDYTYITKGSASVGFNAYNVKHIQSTLFGEKLALRFQIGEVKVTASREELKYDDDTIVMIKKREADAMDEYRDYVLDHIDTTGMKDYEKANFLNQNYNILDLTSDRIKKLVGNPHYKYTKRSIVIPISGWCDYSKLVYTENFVNKKDANGDNVYDMQGYIVQVGTGKTIKKHMCSTHRTLRWSEYSPYENKTKKLNTVQTTLPLEELMIFVRDNSFSFLKKIAYYLDHHDISTSNRILILDMFSDAEESGEALKILKTLLGHSGTFVRLSDITLPKNLALIPSSGYTTPVARVFDTENHNFRNPKYWSDVYTPLTKIETDGAYIIETDRGKFTDKLSWEDQMFMEQYLNTDYPYDENVTILVLSRARYTKAVGYGFKPIQRLIEELKKNVEIPVDVVHADMLDNLQRKINNVDIIQLLDQFTPDELETIDPDTNVARLLRIKNVIQERYHSKENEYRSMSNISEYMEGAGLPEALESVKKMIDTATELCDTMDSGYRLVSDLHYWSFGTPKKRAELVDYIKYSEAKEAELEELKSQEKDDNE